MTSWWLCAALLAQVPANSPTRPWTPVVHGEVSVLGDVFTARDKTREVRGRVRIEATSDATTWLRLRFDGTAEGLVATRGVHVNDARADIRDAWVEARHDRAEIRVGYGRIVWGRLDEVMPSDVINPIDTARFFLDGRAEARLPVAFARGRVFLPGDSSLEMVAALPGRRGRFDGLDETSSPFNLVNDAVPAGVPAPHVVRQTPSAARRNVQSGLRLTTTAGRVDMSVSAWRGFEGFGIITPMADGRLVERYPKFTMVAGDVEMVRGAWALRGEVATFVDKTLSGPVGTVDGKAIDAGLGLDRSAGNFHFFGSVVWHREWSPVSPLFTRSHVNVIASIDRRFSRERYQARVFGVVNPDDRSGFVRALLSWSVRDNVLVEASSGVFLGKGADTISRFSGRDFVFARLRYHF